MTLFSGQRRPSEQLDGEVDFRNGWGAPFDAFQFATRPPPQESCGGGHEHVFLYVANCEGGSVLKNFSSTFEPPSVSAARA